MRKKKIVIALSGGLDSTTLLALYLSKGYQVHCCFFEYGSKHNEQEYNAACQIVKQYKIFKKDVYFDTYDITQCFKSSVSSLMDSSDEQIPRGHYASKTMKSTVVPGRNLIFASILASIAESIEAKKIALGVHSGDHYIYPDCRPEFIQSLQTTITKSTDGKISVIAPFLKKNKSEIISLGIRMNILSFYSLTRTCYTAEKIACGKCGSCVERIEAFEKNGIKDPIQYEE